MKYFSPFLQRLSFCAVFLCSALTFAQDILWEKSYGGKHADYLFDVIPTPDYGFILAGSSLSKKTGNKTDDNRGDLDYWVWKMDEKGDLDWQKSMGGSGYVAKSYSAHANGIATSVSFVQVSGNNSKVLNVASTAVTTTIEFEGVMRCTNGGVLTPLLTFSAAPGGINQMKSGSFIEFTEIGTNLIQTVGAVS